MLSKVLRTSSTLIDGRHASKMALKARKPGHLGRRPITWAERVMGNGTLALFGSHLLGLRYPTDGWIDRLYGECRFIAFIEKNNTSKNPVKNARRTRSIYPVNPPYIPFQMGLSPSATQHVTSRDQGTDCLKNISNAFWQIVRSGKSYRMECSTDSA